MNFLFFIFLTFSLSFQLSANESFLEDQINLNQSESTPASEYPIILHHGLFGFKKILFLEYFNGVPEALRERGYEVFVTKVYPFGSIERRANELSDQIDQILFITGAEKVNIVAHSMGGLDARFAISRLGYADRIASVSMIGTPNRGSYIADLVSTTFLGAGEIKKNFFKLMEVDKIASLDGNKNVVQEALTAIYNCSEDFISKEFSGKIKDHSLVYYQSWAGRTSSIQRIGEDLVGPMFFLPFWLLRMRDGNNDGLVSIKSASWGHYRGVVEADHLDQIGFPLSGVVSNFSHVRFYQKLAGELARKGF